MKNWDCACFLLWQQWKLLSWSIVLHQARPPGPLLVVTDSFLFHFKPWVTEVKYSDPSLHLASKGGIQPLYTVGTSASEDIASIHTGKCLQHLLITSWGKAGFSYRFPVGPGTENISRTVALAEDRRGRTEWRLLYIVWPASCFGMWGIPRRHMGEHTWDFWDPRSLQVHSKIILISLWKNSWGICHLPTTLSQG